VDDAHFTAPVETLKRGQTSSTPGGDLDYTLRAFPNHPRALSAVSRYAIRHGTSKPPQLRWSVDCYFDRAFRFQPSDPMPVMLYGVHLARTGRHGDAIEYLEKAARNPIDDPNFHYNLGLGFFEVKRYEQALVHAKQAYAAGFPLPGLRNRLHGVGAWKD
jgi:tetratricopeptide (TPR) repeat protein